MTERVTTKCCTQVQSYPAFLLKFTKRFFKSGLWLKGSSTKFYFDDRKTYYNLMLCTSHKVLFKLTNIIFLIWMCWHCLLYTSSWMQVPSLEWQDVQETAKFGCWMLCSCHGCIQVMLLVCRPLLKGQMQGRFHQSWSLTSRYGHLGCVLHPQNHLLHPCLILHICRHWQKFRIVNMHQLTLTSINTRIETYNPNLPIKRKPSTEKWWSESRHYYRYWDTHEDRWISCLKDQNGILQNI